MGAWACEYRWVAEWLRFQGCGAFIPLCGVNPAGSSGVFPFLVVLGRRLGAWLFLLLCRRLLSLAHVLTMALAVLLSVQGPAVAWASSRQWLKDSGPWHTCAYLAGVEGL